MNQQQNSGIFLLYFLNFIMQNQQEISISLEQLNQLEEKQENQKYLNHFAVYLSANSMLAQKDNNLYQLTTKDTQRMPQIPIRRVGCYSCLQFNNSCQQCKQCMKSGKICCRDINCIYEFKKYRSSKQDNIYLRCGCMSQFEPSTNLFQVDWRLLSLLFKLGTKQHIKYNYHMHYKVGILFISEQEVEISNLIKINRLIFQDSYIGDPDHLSGIGLGLQNKMHLTDLLKQNIKDYIRRWEKWDPSNFEVSCDQIIRNLLSMKALQQLKQRLLRESKNQEHQFASGKSIKYSSKLVNITESTAKIDQNIYNGLSDAINQNILFYYHAQLQILVLKNAKYQAKDSDNDIKTYQIIWSRGFQKLTKAVWFKDRKGDIFAIHNQFISIFKFHTMHKKFRQIILREDKNLKKIVHSQSILYIPQTDRVYYFDTSNFSSSFYFQLYRPYNSQQKQLSSCYSINPLTALQGRYYMSSFGQFYRTMYIMQEINSKTDRSPSKQLLPVIYLLGQKKSKDSIPLFLYRIIHNKSSLFIEQICPTLQLLDQRQISIDFRKGVVSIFKKDKEPIICFQSYINGNPTLIQGRIHQNEGNKMVEWSMNPFAIQNCDIFQKQKKKHRIQIYDSLNLVQFYSIMRQRQLKPEQEERKGQKYVYVNDLVGYQTNNSAKYLAFVESQNRFVELILNIYQGDYLWKIYGQS